MFDCKVYKHLFLIFTVSMAFYIAGQFGLQCEKFHASLTLSATVFSAIFAGISATIAKVYSLLFLYDFG